MNSKFWSGKLMTSRFWSGCKMWINELSKLSEIWTFLILLEERGSISKEEGRLYRVKIDEIKSRLNDFQEIIANFSKAGENQ